MRISVLASGSKGNCTFIEENNTRILIDLGMSSEYVETKLRELDIDPNTINAILITHTHSDHIKGLSRFHKKYKPIVYIMPSMQNEINRYLHNFSYEYFKTNETTINDLTLNIIKTSHDVKDSVGFIINSKLVYITDTGYLSERHYKDLKNKEIYILESNHDIEMLIDGRYPYLTKQRILSDKGHLSNKDASMHLSKLIGSKTKCIMLAHLSDENNTKEKALEMLLSYISKDDVETIIVTSQGERTELVNI